MVHKDSPGKRLYDEVTRRNVTIGDGWPTLKETPDWAMGNLGKKFYDQLYRVSKHHVSIGSHIHLTRLLSTICWVKVYSKDPELQEEEPNLKKHFAPKFKNVYPWIFSDPHTRPILHAFIKRKELIPKNIWKRVKISIEQGMYQRIILTAEAMEDFLIKNKKIKKGRHKWETKDYSRKVKVKVGFCWSL